jgi:hypothetical protein
MPPSTESEDSSAADTSQSGSDLDQRLLFLVGTVLFVGGMAAVAGVGSVGDLSAAGSPQTPAGLTPTAPGDSMATPTATPDGGGAVETASPTPTPTGIATSTSTPTPTPTPEATETDDGVIVIGG